MKAFVIRLKGVEDSEKLADDCVASGLSHGLSVDKFDGIYGLDAINETMARLDVRPFSQKMKKDRLGVKGCFLSHYSLWLKSVELNESIVIFEHDGMMLRPLPSNIENMFDEFLMLDPYNKFTGNYGEQHSQQADTAFNVVEYSSPDSRKKYGISAEYAMGLQAYIIKPKAALKLINSIKETGFFPADMQCNKDIINLQTIYPSIASVNKLFYKNAALMNELSTTQKKWT
jgi:glycosyl transferase family 25